MAEIDDLLQIEQQYCSQGDTAGIHTPKKIFAESKSCYLIDHKGIQYLDMQMQNSAANFGYRNTLFTECAIEQLNTLPSLAAEFLNKEYRELKVAVTYKPDFEALSRSPFLRGQYY